MKIKRTICQNMHQCLPLTVSSSFSSCGFPFLFSTSCSFSLLSSRAESEWASGVCFRHPDQRLTIICHNSRIQSSVLSRHVLRNRNNDILATGYRKWLLGADSRPPFTHHPFTPPFLPLAVSIHTSSSHGYINKQLVRVILGQAQSFTTYGLGLFKTSEH